MDFGPWTLDCCCMTLLELPTIRRASESPLIGALLAEQQTLTAVERFAEAKQNGDAGRQDPRVYRDLIPLTMPQKGEQYAFSVDLDACSGCKACVVACHKLNGFRSKDLCKFRGDNPFDLYAFYQLRCVRSHTFYYFLIKSSDVYECRP